MNSARSPVLLDTHTFVWMVAGQDDRFSAQARNRIELALEQGVLLFSVASVWELAHWVAQRRVILNRDPALWARQAVARTRARWVEMEPEIAAVASTLPEHFGSDWIDRVLLATSQRYLATLITADPKLVQLGREEKARVMALR